MITTSSQWDSLSKWPGQLLVVARLYYGDGTNYISLSSKDFILDSERFLGVLKTIPSIEQMVNIETHNPTIGSLSVSIDNLNFQPEKRFSDLLEELGVGADIGFENRQADVRLFLPGITSFANCFKLQEFGIIRDPSHNRQETKFKIEDGIELSLTKLENLIEEADTPQNVIPVESLDKVKPDVYGDHSFEGIKTTVPAEVTLEENKNNMIPAVRISQNSYLFESHELNEIGTDDIWLFDNQTKRFLLLDSSHVTINNPDGNGNCTIDLTISGEYAVYDWWFPESAENLITNDHDWSQIANAVDKDIDTFATLAAVFTTPATAEDGELRLHFPDYDLTGFIQIEDIEIFYRGKYQLAAGDGSDLTYKIAGSGIPVAAILNIKGITTTVAINDAGSSGLQSTRHDVEFRDGDGGDTYKLNYDGSETGNIVETDNNAAIEAILEALSEFDDVDVAAAGGTDRYAISYEGNKLGRNVKLPEVRDRTDSISININTIRDGLKDTIDMVSDYLELRVYQTVSALTPTTNIQCHAIYKKIKLIFEGNAIDHNRFTLFAACKGREYGGWIADRDIAVGGFSEDHADNNNDNQLIENPAGVIESLLRDSLSLGNDNIDRDSFNIASNVVSSLKVSNAIIESVESRELLAELLKDFRSFLWWQNDGTFKIKSIKDTYSASDRVIDFNDVKDLKFTRTNPKDIRTAVKVKYNWNGERFLSVTSLAQDTDQQTKYNITLAQSTLVHESKNIGDVTTANAVRAFLLAWFKQPHNIAVCQTGKENLDLDIGDIIEFRNMPYKVRGEDITGNVTRGGQTIYKYWWIYKVRRGENMNLRAIQLHDLS